MGSATFIYVWRTPLLPVVMSFADGARAVHLAVADMHAHAVSATHSRLPWPRPVRHGGPLANQGGGGARLALHNITASPDWVAS